MASVSRHRDRQRLEQNLQTDEYNKLLQNLQRREPYLRQFKTWGDVLGFMREGTSRESRKDEILRPMFKAHAEDKDPRWRAILLAIFWPGLKSIHLQKHGWDPDPEELWHNIVWIFLQVLCRIDVKRRPNRLVQKVFNDTVHRLHDEYRRAWDRMDRESPAEPEEIEALAGGVEGIDFVGIELRETQRMEIDRLREHMKAARITEADFLLLGTRVYGSSIAHYARAVGLDYEVAKKRRQRAETAIRRFEEEK